MKYLLGLFLLAHGLLHASYLTPKPSDPNDPFNFTKGWLYQALGQPTTTIGIGLAGITVFAFAVAALSVFGVPGFVNVGKIAAVIGAISSLLLLILFWHQWLILGIIINLVILYGIYQLNWTFGS